MYWRQENDKSSILICCNSWTLCNHCFLFVCQLPVITSFHPRPSMGCCCKTCFGKLCKRSYKLQIVLDRSYGGQQGATCRDKYTNTPSVPHAINNFRLSAPFEYRRLAKPRNNQISDFHSIPFHPIFLPIFQDCLINHENQIQVRIYNQIIIIKSHLVCAFSQVPKRYIHSS